MRYINFYCLLFDILILHRLPLFIQETIRRRQAEAAEKRIAEQQQRGIKDIESVKRQQRRALELEKREQEAAANSTQPTLKVKTPSNYTFAAALNYLIVYLKKN